MIIVAGNGKSGRSAYDFLKRKGESVRFLSQDDLDKKSFKKQELDRLFEGLSFIVKSPGISFENEFIKQAKVRKIKVIDEFELGAKNIKSNILAVTGTNGKTTTVSLINFLLKGYKNKTFLGGNIGVPVTSFCDKVEKEDSVILECSSFQLEKYSSFKPHVSAILNVTPDHLNRHKTFKNYVKAKYNICKSQTENDFLILNADDEFLLKNPPKTKAQVFYFSTKKQVKGCYVKNGYIYFNDNLVCKKLASVKIIKLVGDHNLSNVLCGILMVYLKTKNFDFISEISNFVSVPHRIEFVKKISGIEFFNDSKATNISSALSAINSFKSGINLILGGSDKGYEFDEIFAKIPKNVKNIAVFGQTKQKIALSAKKFGFENLYVCDSLKSATLLLFELASIGEVVLLSPACASFDCFSNYEERGEFFKKIVKEIDDENSLFDAKTKT